MTIIDKEVRIHLSSRCFYHSGFPITPQTQSPFVSTAALQQCLQHQCIHMLSHFLILKCFQFTRASCPWIGSPHSTSMKDVLSCPLHRGGNRDSEKRGDFPKITQQHIKLGLPLLNRVLSPALRLCCCLSLVIMTALEVANFPVCSLLPRCQVFETKLGFACSILKHQKVLSSMDLNQMCEEHTERLMCLPKQNILHCRIKLRVALL